MGYIIGIWFFMLFLVFLAGIWSLGYKKGRKSYEQEIINEALTREQESEQKLEQKMHNSNRPKREVVFVDTEEEEEFEAPKPAGQHIYDSKQHKVVWVPAE